MYVRLKKKLANVMNGVDVSQALAGDILELTDAQGAMLIAEDWAEPFGSPDSGSGSLRTVWRLPHERTWKC